MTVRRAAFGTAMAGAAWAAVALAPASAQDFGPNRRPESQSGRTNSQDVGALKRRIDELERRLEDMSANGTASGPSARAPAGARAGGSAGEKFAELEIERLYDMAVLNFRRGNDLAARNLFETVIARGADSPFANKSQEYLRLLYRNDRRAGTGRGERRWHWRDLGAPYPGADQNEADRDERAGSSGVRERPEPEQRRAEPAQREPGVRDAGVRGADPATFAPVEQSDNAAGALL